MSLSLRAATGDPVGVEALRGLGGNGQWMTVVDAAPPYLRKGDTVFLVRADGRAIGLAVEASGGVLRLGARAREGALALVSRLWRKGCLYSFDRWPLRIGLGAPRVWPAVNAGWRVYFGARLLAAQSRPTPRAPRVERSVVDYYDTPASAEEYAVGANDGLTDAEVSVAQRCFRPGERVLDVGCGAGREALGLARIGIDVVGIDVSARSVEHARRAAASAGLDARVTFRAEALASVRAEPRSFDGAILSSDVYASIPGRDARVDALRRCHDLLRSGARIAVAAGCGPSWRARLAVDAPRRLARAVGLRYEPGDRWYFTPSPHGPGDVLVYRHVFRDEDEVSRELEAGGFRSIGAVSTFFLAERAS